jgi:type VI secretion system secreted protein Hcp
MAVDVFLKIEGIEGETKDSKHSGEIEILSWSWGVTQQGTMGANQGGGAGKANFQDLSWQHNVDKASHKLMLACATGQHIPSATLSVRKAGGEQQDYLTYKLSDILVTSVQNGASSEVPVEQVSFNYAKVEFEYKVQDEKGKVGAPQKFGYDLKKNVKA